MKNNNCPNCGAVIEPYSCKCQYCGTWYYDLTLFDTVDSRPRYIKIRATDRFGDEVYVTALARPASVTIESKIEHARSAYADDMRFIATTNKTCDVTVQFECFQDTVSGSLFQIQEGE